MNNIALIFTILLVLLIVAAIIYYKITKKYSKARFLFTAWAGLLSISVMYLNMLLGDTFPWHIFAEYQGDIGQLSVANTKPGLSDKILGFLVLFLAFFFVNSIYKNWSGDKTEYDKEKSDYGKISNIFVDAMELIKDREARLKSTQKASKEIHINRLMNATIDGTQSWFIQSLELFLLSFPYFSLSTSNGTLSSIQSYLLIHDDTNETVLLVSCNNNFSQENLREISSYIQSHAKDVNKIQFFFESQEHHKIERDFNTDFKIIYKNEILKKLGAFTSYHDFLEKEFNKPTFGENQNLSLNDIYCESAGVLQKGMSIPNVEEYLLKWTQENSTRQLAVLGEYGQGKSVLSLKLALEIFNRYDEIGLTPIIIELRGKSPRNLSKHELLAIWSTNYHINYDITVTLYELGKLVLIFDAFDEMDLIGDPQSRMQHFASLWQFAAVPNSKVIITGRPNLFLDENSLKEALGILEKSITLPYCEAIELDKFNLNQIEVALRNFDDEIKNDILAYCSSLPQSNTFLDLISRPSTLALVASIWNKFKGTIKADGATSSSIIKEFIQHTYLRQYEKQRKDIEAKPIISYSEREYFMYGIALKMLNHRDHQNQIESITLESTILELLESIPEKVSTMSSAFDTGSEPLNKRIKGLPHGKNSVITDVCTSGILVLDPSKPDSFKFAHKSFFEFLAANIMASYYKKPKASKDLLIFNSLKRKYSLYNLEKKISKEIAVFIGQIILKNSDLNSSATEKAKELELLLFSPRKNNIFIGPTLAYQMLQKKIGIIFGPYDFFFMVVVVGRLRVFTAYCLLELNMTREEIEEYLGSRLMDTVMTNTNERLFEKKGVFHSNFNLIPYQG